MKQFDLKEYLANPERKVVTREGAVVKIITTGGQESYHVIGYIDDIEGTFSWCSDGRFLKDTQTPYLYDLFFADNEPTVDLPKWRRAKAGRKLPSEAVIIYDIDPEPRLGKVMVNDGRYMLIEELEELPEE